MLITSCTLQFVGETLCGQTLVPNDEDSLYACYEGDNVTTGVSLEFGAHQPYLRLVPAIHIPASAVPTARIVPFVHEDERFGDVSIDVRDGEVIMMRNLRRTDLPSIERELDDCLAFLDQVGYPALLEVVARCEGLRREGKLDEAEPAELAASFDWAQGAPGEGGASARLA